MTYALMGRADYQSELPRVEAEIGAHWRKERYLSFRYPGRSTGLLPGGDGLINKRAQPADLV